MKQVLVLLLSIGSHIAIAQNQPVVWAGLLDYGNVNVPFHFETVQIGAVHHLTLINGEERIALSPIRKDTSQQRVELPPFDAFLKLRWVGDSIYGTWEKPYRDLVVKFVATPGSRFARVKNPPSIDDRWGITLKPRTPDAYPGIGLFQQEEGRVTGTIMTEVGDFRYFEGVVFGDSVKLSSFDGAHGFYFLGKKKEGKWSGTFHFDPAYSERWEAKEGDTTELKDPFELIRPSGSKRTAYFDLLAAGSGRNVIDPSDFTGKVLVVQVFGTWCPNSWDESRFLVDWYRTRPEGVELVAATFEPNYSQAYGLERIAAYTKHLDITYPVYLGGRMSKQHAAMPFPFIDQIAAFPTLVIFDKSGEVRYIHSYFNGPATGVYYEQFKQSFNEKIEELLAE